MKKLMDAADPAVAESGRHLKKFNTMQELWEARPDLKDASLFMANLVENNPKMTKVEIQRVWDKQRGVYPETSGVHMESNSLFSHGYLSMKILREYANGGNRKASSNSSDANATAALLAVSANCIWRSQARFDNASAVLWEVACASFFPSSNPL
jgi:hypothetical protein